ncbi:hypothetical protein MC7420_3311 [Coleofasciculus chthonoplastes PCC 7420]|uniref:Uncharacterized protein n=1 Tax=Coleofasciculus chthonoplastes PCC 7420 TaxID=118168 RepID=B4VZ63_9CYAN|nr:hypothetical protein MC7420_3311 [Coleofasciculus chthonoplastes PCC 7420]
MLVQLPLKTVPKNSTIPAIKIAQAQGEIKPLVFGLVEEVG